MVVQPLQPSSVTFAGDSIEGQKITVRVLIDVLESALVWLRGKDPNSLVEWEVVRIRLGNRLRLTLCSTETNGDISNRMRNLHELQMKKRPRVLPRLTDEDIDGTRQLASLLRGDFKSMRISSPGAPPVRLTDALINRVEEIARENRGPYYEWGTLRGYLDQITVRRKPTFRIRHALTGADIACKFPDELLDQVKDALPARVEVYGRIRRNRSDAPTSVEVERFRVLSDPAMPFDELRAVNITDGVDAADYVEGIRSGR